MMLRRRLGCQLAIFVALFAIAKAQAPGKPSETELAAITARGVLLAEYDSAAWQATDAVQAAHPVEGRGVSRYIAQTTDAGWVVDFGRLNQAQDKFLVVYEAVQVSAKFEVKSFDPPIEDKGWNLAAAKGIETVMRDFGATTRPYNVAVLPEGHHHSMYVYLYPAQVKAGVYPLGADVRYRVTLDGMKIIEKRQMHKSIIESIPTRSDITVKVGYHSHVLSEIPEDTDVLLVLTRQPRLPEIVVAGPYMFTIDVNGQIKMEDRPNPKNRSRSGRPQ